DGGAGAGPVRRVQPDVDGQAGRRRGADAGRGRLVHGVQVEGGQRRVLAVGDDPLDGGKADRRVELGRAAFPGQVVEVRAGGGGRVEAGHGVAGAQPGGVFERLAERRAGVPAAVAEGAHV